MMNRAASISALAILAISGSAQAQPDEAIVRGSDLGCSRARTAPSYGTVQRFDGIMFSYIDGVSFTPCENARRCDADTTGAALDLEWSAGVRQPKLERVWDGWGYYRLTFVGRRGSRLGGASCDLDAGDFFEIRRVLSARRLEDRRNRV
jgi:hypothetical protein